MVGSERRHAARCSTIPTRRGASKRRTVPRAAHVEQSLRHLCKRCAEAIIPPTSKAGIRHALDRLNEQLRRGDFGNAGRRSFDFISAEVDPTKARRSCRLCGEPAAFRRPDDAVPDDAADWLSAFKQNPASAECEFPPTLSTAMLKHVQRFSPSIHLDVRPPDPV